MSASSSAGPAGRWGSTTSGFTIYLSFVTNARRRGVPESVVMRMSGHRTRSVFDRYNVIEDEDIQQGSEGH